ncbi:hypothetical protein B0I35DRAFT_427483 [Stachybotrys elegans]|uniref:SnoaL-like domain-containing protein n=1 Tax=Stachybotrys elegans TaxID=80388 RepID=A0A8K0SRC3_9HYPO|nr:hypothetical protein B0I35DRAFT_427483 [Stachybotrys elegans]
MSSKRLETAASFISHFEHLDASILETILADNYFHQLAPGALTGQGPSDKRGLIEFVTSMKTMMTGSPMVAKQIVDSESSNAVTIWASGQLKFRDELMDEQGDWDCPGEYMFILFMDETGEKIVKTIEFVDSKAADRTLELFTRAGENLSKASKAA